MTRSWRGRAKGSVFFVSEDPRKAARHRAIQRAKLSRAKGHGHSKFWFAPNVTIAEKEDLEGAFKRLPPAVQHEIKKIEVYGKGGRVLRVGSNEFKEGGHWDEKAGTIRVFAGGMGKKWIKNFENSDFILAHEGGHALFDKLEDKASDEPSYADLNPSDIEDRVRGLRKKKVEAINAKYEPELERMHKEWQTLLDRGVGTWDLAEMKKLSNERDQKERQMKRVFAKRDREIGITRQEYSPEVVVERLELHKRPFTKKLGAFRQATQDEGGLTNYSQSYISSKSPTMYTENFAEATKIWYSAGTDLDPSDVAQKFPKTYKAYMSLIHPEVMGHAVSLKDRPLRRD